MSCCLICNQVLFRSNTVNSSEAAAGISAIRCCCRPWLGIYFLPLSKHVKIFGKWLKLGGMSCSSFLSVKGEFLSVKGEFLELGGQALDFKHLENILIVTGPE